MCNTRREGKGKGKEGESNTNTATVTLRSMRMSVWRFRTQVSNDIVKHKKVRKEWCNMIRIRSYAVGWMTDRRFYAWNGI